MWPDPMSIGPATSRAAVVIGLPCELIPVAGTKKNYIKQEKISTVNRKTKEEGRIMN